MKSGTPGRFDEVRRASTDAEFDRNGDGLTTTEPDIERRFDRARRGVGRPSLGKNGPSGVLQVRLDNETRAKLKARAVKEHATPSKVVRDALHAWLTGP